MEELNAQEAKDLIDRIGPHIGCGDFTYAPMFPEGRTDVCAIRRMAENGSDYGFDTIYLVWKQEDGGVQYKALKNTRATKDYMSIDSITAAEDGSITVSFGSGGTMSGKPWKQSVKAVIEGGDAKVSVIAS